MGTAAGRGAAAGPRWRTVLIAALALVALPVAVEARAAAAPNARDEAELLARAGEARYRLALLRSRKTDPDPDPDLAAALRALEEARELDPANLRALAYLGLARLESAARGGKPLDPEAFDPVRGPLEELFKLSRGWADPRTRALLAEVARSVDASLAGRDDAPADVLGWWKSWRERVTKTARSAPPAAGVVTLIEDLRTSPLAWVRERAVEKLAEREAKPRPAASRSGTDATPPEPGVVEALGKTLREDKSPWVRAAAAKALSTLMPPGWDIRLAEALRNDASVFVRRTCAEGLAGLPDHIGRGPGLSGAVREALLGSLASDTPRVAAMAALMLGQLGGSEKDLVGAIESPASLVRDAASEALRLHAEDAEISGMLTPLFSHGDARVRAAALCALGTGPDHLPDQTRGKVVALLGDPEATVRADAAIALFGRVPDSAVVRLRGLLEDDELSVRLAAAHALLAKEQKTALPVLEKLADSKVPLVSLGGHPGEPGITTIGEAAGRIIAEHGKKQGTQP
jgi:HEAT repeat protein